MPDAPRDAHDIEGSTLELRAGSSIALSPTLPAVLPQEVLVALGTTISGVEATVDAAATAPRATRTLGAASEERYQLGEGGPARSARASGPRVRAAARGRRDRR
ncbi:MAG: hypothetical protein KF729_06175 [Sandaracinaceae bacterium]|nr:hypothetical protein [Sandaracinaceae bacterium]